MSGKQAKKKRKSAKKAAKSPAPVFGNDRPEEFIIGNLRCFADEQRVPIRPITLLVGANSTGKTTFLGGYRALHQLTAFPFSGGLSGLFSLSWFSKSAPSFNDEPFPMGAFRDIVNRGAMKHSAPQFQLGARVAFRAFSSESGSDKKPKRETRKERHGKLDLLYSFQESGSSAAVRGVSVIFSNGEKIEVVLGEHQFEGSHHLAVIDPRTGKPMDMGGLSRAIYAHEISSAFSFVNPRGNKLQESMKARESMKNITEILNRQFYPGAAETSLRSVNFFHDSAEYSLAPIRSKPKRTYNPMSDEYNPEGDHIPMLLAQLSRTKKDEWEKLRGRLVDFGKESVMFSDFNVKGLGRQVSDPFQIHVKAAGVMSNLLDVGYGVGQVYPLLVQIMRATQRGIRATFLLQEPEVHLHPQAQAALASFFAKSAKKDGHAFIIETHGDSVIDRVRVCVKRGEIAPEDVVILYFEPQKKSGSVKIHPIRVDKLGNVLDAPRGYRQFFLDETDRLLGFKK